MAEAKKPIVILLADNHDGDALLTEKALKEYKILNKMYRVRNSEELMDFLLKKGDFQDPAVAPHPALILLDLNMPKKDGREALKEIKSHPDLKRIPITILTTSKSDEDIVRSYDLGVNSFITKPVQLKKLMSVITKMGDYCFEVVQ